MGVSRTIRGCPVPVQTNAALRCWPLTKIKDEHHEPDSEERSATPSTAEGNMDRARFMVEGVITSQGSFFVVSSTTTTSA